MPRTWRSAFAPFLAGVPHRTGSSARPGWPDQRSSLRRAPASPHGRPLCHARPAQGRNGARAVAFAGASVPAAELSTSRRRLRLAPDGAVRAAPPRRRLCAAPVGPSKRWPTAYYADLARRLAGEGNCAWVMAARAKGSLPRRSCRRANHLTKPISAILPGPTCAMRFSRSRRRTSWCRTIRVSCTSRPRSARQRSEFSVPQARGIRLH